MNLGRKDVNVKRNDSNVGKKDYALEGVKVMKDDRLTDDMKL